MITVPAEVLASARQGETELAAKWFCALLASFSIECDTSPADYPDEVFAAFRTLSEASLPDLAPDVCPGLRRLLAFTDGEEGGSSEKSASE